MKVILQRVSEASVSVGGAVISSIGPGLLCLTGITHTDCVADVEWMVKKLLRLKLWPNDADKPWKSTIRDSSYELLCVSQFTLYGSFNYGTKPDFHLAMEPGKAKVLYATFLEALKKEYSSEKIKDGQFGAMMNVSLVNDGPVTFELCTDQLTLPGKAPVSPSMEDNGQQREEANTEPLVKKIDYLSVDLEKVPVFIKRVQKKLNQIKTLKKNQAAGKELTDLQSKKLGTEKELVENLDLLKSRLSD